MRREAASGKELSQNAHASFRVVVAGEFNSGKSSLINLLLRRKVIPASVGYSRMPPLQIDLTETTRSAGRPQIQLFDQSGQEVLATALPSDPEIAQRLSKIEMNTPCPELSGVSLIEVSVGEDGRMSPQCEAELRSADLIVWCTMGQRAWCLSEITIIESLPETCLSGAILAITRTDLLDAQARELVRARVEPLTRDFFPRIVMVNASHGSLKRAGDAESWELAGGQAIFEAVRQAYQDHLASPPEASKHAGKKGQAQPDPETLLHAAWSAEMADLETLILSEAKLSVGTLHAEIQRRLEGLVRELPQTACPPLGRSLLRAHVLLASGRIAPTDDLLALDLAIQLQDRFSPGSQRS